MFSRFEANLTFQFKHTLYILRFKHIFQFSLLQCTLGVFKTHIAFQSFFTRTIETMCESSRKWLNDAAKLKEFILNENGRLTLVWLLMGGLGQVQLKNTEPDFEERSMTFKIHLFADVRMGSTCWWDYPVKNMSHFSMFYHVTYAFQSESILNKCLNVMKLLGRKRRNIWSLSNCNRTRTHKRLVRKRTLNHFAKIWQNGWVMVECSFTNWVVVGSSPVAASHFILDLAVFGT